MITKTQDKLSALSPKLQAIVPIAAFTAKGEMQNLRAALESGLEADLSVREIKGVLVQLYSYAGFPRCLNAIAEFMDVLKDRQQRGLASESDLAAGPLPKALAGETVVFGPSKDVVTGDLTVTVATPVRVPGAPSSIEAPISRNRKSGRETINRSVSFPPATTPTSAAFS